MKKNLFIVLFSLMLLIVASPIMAADSHRVRGYWADTNRDGIKDTYVQPHSQTNPNSIRTDNYSYPGNYNPNKGAFTPHSNSDRETYPMNPNPYDKPKKRSGYGW
ncbi:MAG TPA: hypothetical protein PK575_13915 [Syntrophorhabdus sp.]|nr:hypothetical protein [Syntrophorhabdus sp.]